MNTPTTYRIQFDGGSKGPDGHGYGSAAVYCGETLLTVLRFDFGPGVTNNEAEYRSLIDGLAWMAGKDTPFCELVVEGDSMLVVEQVAGRWRTKDARMKALCAQAKLLVARWGRSIVKWIPRERNVEVLGH